MKNLKGGNNLTVRVREATFSSSSGTLSSNLTGHIQKKLDLSSRKTTLVCKVLMKANLKIDKYTRDSLVAKGRELDDFYDLQTVPMEVEDHKKMILVDKDLVYMKDVQAFVGHLTEVK